MNLIYKLKPYIKKLKVLFKKLKHLLKYLKIAYSICIFFTIKFLFIKRLDF